MVSCFFPATVTAITILFKDKVISHFKPWIYYRLKNLIDIYLMRYFTIG